MGAASGGLPKKRTEGQRVVLRTGHPGVDLLQLAAKSVSGGSNRARGVFHRNFSQTGRQRNSGKHRNRRAADRDTCRSRRGNSPGHHPGAERMLTDFKGADHVYIACGYTDLRRGIDGLASLVQQQFELDPFSNTLFLFCGRRRDRIKGLYWEENGFILLYKRLESGSFQWPRNGAEARELSAQQYRWLMEGLSVEQPKAHRPVEGLSMK